MIRKFLLAVTLCLSCAAALAAATVVDVNKADRAALESIRGIGPASAEVILAERKKGNFRDWADFESRVRGVGDARGIRLSDAGLTVNGDPRPAGTGAAAPKKSGEAKK